MAPSAQRPQATVRPADDSAMATYASRVISSRQAAARLSSAVLYERAAVGALAAWPVVTDDLVDSLCPWGLFVARQRLDTWAFSPMTSVWIWSRIERHGHLPFVSTICGFVTDGAEITRTIPVSGGGYQTSAA